MKTHKLISLITLAGVSLVLLILWPVFVLSVIGLACFPAVLIIGLVVLVRKPKPAAVTAQALREQLYWARNCD